MKVQLPLFISKCRSVRQLLWEYAGERLSEGPMETVERHLETCARCQREVESLRRAQTLLKAYRQQEPAPPRSDWSALRERLLMEGGNPVQRGLAVHSGLRNRQDPFAETKRTLRYREWLPTLASVGVLAAALIIVTCVQEGRVAEGVRRGGQTPVADRTPLPLSPATAPATTVAEVNPDAFSLTSWPVSFSGAAAIDTPAPTNTHKARSVQPERTDQSVPQKRHLRLLADSKQDRKPAKVQFVPTQIKPEDRPSSVAQNTLRPDADHFQTVGSSQHFVMGTLEPTQHDDDSTY